MQNESPRKTRLVRRAPRIWHLLIGLVMVGVGVWIIYSAFSSRVSGPTATINSQAVSLEVADEQDEITRGLGGRESLPNDSGMLFVMPEPIIPNFWMKDMLFPIDFIWIDEEMKIVAITPSIGVDSYPITFSPPSPVKYVLEVNAGLSAHNGWLPGDSVELAL
ncbi:MAG TPA: DUF192 domain-containing protein [Candidatus Saccharimonadales bacterium]